MGIAYGDSFPQELSEKGGKSSALLILPDVGHLVDHELPQPPGTGMNVDAVAQRQANRAWAEESSLPGNGLQL